MESEVQVCIFLIVLKKTVALCYNVGSTEVDGFLKKMQKPWNDSALMKASGDTYTQLILRQLSSRRRQHASQAPVGNYKGGRAAQPELIRWERKERES